MEFFFGLWAAVMLAATIGWFLMAPKRDWRDLVITLLVASIPAALFIGTFWGKIGGIEDILKDVQGKVSTLTDEVYQNPNSLKTQTALMRADLEYVRPRVIRGDFDREIARLNQELTRMREPSTNLETELVQLRRDVNELREENRKLREELDAFRAAQADRGRPGKT